MRRKFCGTIRQEEYMLKRSLIVAALLLPAMSTQAQDVSSEKGQLSYAIGWDIAANLKRREGDFNVDSIVAAIRDAMNDAEPRVPLADMQSRLVAFQEKVRTEQLEQFQALAEENQQKSEQFLAENRGKTGIVVLPSGVQYRIIEEGSGPRPNMDDTVTVHYRGSNMEGREFDSSFARGEPVEFQVNSVLKGWQEVLPLMTTGSTWQVFLPPEMAFGTRGQPPIGPNEALMFDIKLVQIGGES